MEQLSKSQLVLLALLVSFVTSIATGIVTVSLMEQAPPTIAQTVNRVIERTVETVVPAGQTAASAVTRERTVVVRESELISQAVSKVSPSVVRVYANSSEAAAFLALGVVLSTEGNIVTDASALATSTEVAVALSDGTRVRARVSSREAATGFAHLQATTTEAVSWQPATIAGDTPILGQSVVVLAGRSAFRLGDGIVTALTPLGEEGSISLIDTSISSDGAQSGSPLINTDGEVIGVSTSVSRASSATGFIASSALIQKAPEEDKKPAE